MAVCSLRIEHLDHPARFWPVLVPAETEIADELAQPQQPAKALVRILLRKLDEQDGFGIAVHHRVDGGLEHGDVAREREHGAVHELDRDRTELHDVLRRIHGLREIAEMAGANGTTAEEGRELELDLGGEGERAFRSHQNVREVELIAPRRERVEIVAADPALHLGKARLDLVRLLRGQRAQRARDRHQRRADRNIRKIGSRRSEMRRLSVGEDRIDRMHVLAGIAVAERSRPAGIVGDHAADGGARGGRDVDGEPQSVRLEPAVELVEHDARLDDATALRNIELNDVIEVFRAVDHEGRIDGLPGLRGAGAAREHAHPFLAREKERVLRFLDGARGNDAHRHHLIMRRVGGVAPARERIELDVAEKPAFEPLLQPRRNRASHAGVLALPPRRGDALRAMVANGLETGIAEGPQGLQCRVVIIQLHVY